MNAISQRRRWAYSLIRRCDEPPPSYGSAEWSRLLDGSPDKIASLVIAAEAWAQSKDTLAEDLAREIDAARHVNKQIADAEYVDRYQAHRNEWRHLRIVEPYADRRTRELVEAAKPRLSDHRGRDMPMCPEACGSACWRLADGTALPGVECRPPVGGSA